MNNSEKDKIWHIAGIGAIGTLISSLFDKSGQSVNLILKNHNQLDNYLASGLHLTISDETTAHYPKASVISDPGNKPIERLITCCKSYDVLHLLSQLKNSLTKNSLIILIHNGLGVIEDIESSFPDQKIIAGICTHGAYLKKPFDATAFIKGTLHLGSVVGQLSDHEKNAVKNSFNAALPFQWEDNIKHFMWQKFAVNCCINLLTVLHQCQNGGLLNFSERVESITREVAVVLRAYDVKCTDEELLSTVINVVQNTADNYSSMYKDVLNDRLTELKYLNEHLTVLAHKKNISLPFNQQLVDEFYYKISKLKSSLTLKQTSD